MSSKKVFQIVYQCIVKRYGEEDHPSRVPEEPENPQTQENKCCQYRISKLAGISLFDGIDQRVPDGQEAKIPSDTIASSQGQEKLSEDKSASNTTKTENGTTSEAHQPKKLKVSKVEFSHCLAP